MNLVLGDVLETIYIVDEDDDEEEIRVREFGQSWPIAALTYLQDDHKEIRDAVCSR